MAPGVPCAVETLDLLRCGSGACARSMIVFVSMLITGDAPILAVIQETR